MSFQVKLSSASQAQRMLTLQIVLGFGSYIYLAFAVSVYLEMNMLEKHMLQ